jgi:hypothetical protein
MFFFDRMEAVGNMTGLSKKSDVCWRYMNRSPSFLKKFIIIVFLILTACTSMLTKSPTTGELRLNYTIGDCNEDIPLDRLDSWAEITIAVEKGKVRLHHNLAYVCCADLFLKMEREGNTIKIIEINKGDYCECMCGYEIEASILGLPDGHYTVQIWGVEYQNLETPELLKQTEIDIE